MSQRGNRYRDLEVFSEIRDLPPTVPNKMRIAEHKRATPTEAFKRKVLAAGNPGRSLDWATGDGGVERELINVRGDYPEVVTVTLIAPAPALVAPLAFVNHFTAVLEWGHGGTQATAEVDFVNGCSFQLSGSFIRVVGRREALEGAGNTVRLGAFLSYLPVNGTNRPKRTTRDTVALAAGAPGRNFVLPRFATDVRVYRITPTNAFDVRFIDSAAGLVGTVNVGAGQAMATEDIPNDARAINLEAGVGGLAGQRLVFGLSL